MLSSIVGRNGEIAVDSEKAGEGQRVTIIGVVFNEEEHEFYVLAENRETGALMTIPAWHVMLGSTKE